jgi:hypothetical protein
MELLELAVANLGYDFGDSAHAALRGLDRLEQG